MFGKLPELFSRNFAIAYFLPVSALLAISYAIASAYGYLKSVQALNNPNNFSVLIGTTVIALFSWFGGIVLMAANRDILRLMEGYGRLNPLRLLGWIERIRFRRLRSAIEKLDNEYLSYEDAGKSVPDKIVTKRASLMLKAASFFPEEHLLLPTSFGNTIRAFEVYPRKMYGIDAIPGWIRLQSCVPEQFSDVISDAKARVDFWVNLGLLCIVALGGYAAAAIVTRRIEAVWIPVALVVITPILYHRAGKSAAQWGEYIKASFDLYLPDLATKLGYRLPPNRNKERALWKRFSQAVLYVDPEVLPDRAHGMASSSANTAARRQRNGKDRTTSSSA